MKLIFVGIHNKPGLQPLCSSTRSGKMIDRILNEGGFTDMVWLKTNLYNTDYKPETPEEKTTLANDWWKRIHAKGDDVIVLLGQEVHDNWKPLRGKYIMIQHPSRPKSREAKDGYVKQAIELILQKMGQK